MSATLEMLVDGAIGETRHALVRDGRVIALDILRASDEGRRARWGETYAGRVRAVDRTRRGAFVELGLKDDVGFLPLGADGMARRKNSRVPLREGEAIAVSVAREAARGKGPVLALIDGAGEGAPRRVETPEGDADLRSAKPASADVRARIDAAIEEALSRTAPIPGGGMLTIEPTAALVAIDVDAGGRKGGQPDRFALELNLAAAGEIARQLRVRNLAGIVAIDFVSMRSVADRSALEQVMKAAFAGDPWSVQFGRLSRFGIFELTRAQLRTPLHERLRDSDGRLSAETVALSALRAIEREAAAAGGRRIVASLAPEVAALAQTYTAQLTARIGPRFAIKPADTPRERVDVRAV